MPSNNRPLAALRALFALARDPDDLPQVFTVIDALPGRSTHRLLRRTRETATGRLLLATQPDLRVRLGDRAALRALPAESLGRAYLEHAERAGISADGIADASMGSAIPRATREAELAWVDDRMRDTHDLWHVVTGYGTDLLGEVSLLAFSYAQTRHVGVALVASLSLVRRLPGAPRMLVDGYRRGARAAYLPALPWEELLERPLDEVRRVARIDAVPAYAPITSEDLRASGVIAPKRAA